MHTTTTRAQAAPALRSAAPAALQRLRQFLRTPKGSLLAIFLGLFGLGATAVGWPLAVPHMLAAVLGASVTDVAIYLLVGLLAGNGALAVRRWLPVIARAISAVGAPTAPDRLPAWPRSTAVHRR